MIKAKREWHDAMYFNLSIDGDRLFPSFRASG
jgi:hypothetical protein